jgi:hypothetical protein
MRNPLTKILFMSAGYWASMALKRYVERGAAKRKADKLQISNWEDEGGAPAPARPATASTKS